MKTQHSTQTTLSSGVTGTRLMALSSRIAPSFLVALSFAIAMPAFAEDPFEAGEDALAVKPSDGSASVRAKLKLSKLDEMTVMARVVRVDASTFPQCTLTAKVLRGATSKAKHFKLLGRGKTYRFRPQIKRRRGRADLKHAQTRANLGACYYPRKTKLLIKVSGVDLKAKLFIASELGLK